MAHGVVHLYYGDGKGKTTAAMGLTLRALGQGLVVNLVQFMKDGRSGELALLRRAGTRVWAGKPGMKFPSKMSAEESEAIKIMQTKQLREALDCPCDMLVLDEACSAWRWELVERALLKEAVLSRPLGREVVLTGREPAQWMLDAAGYLTQMRCEKHSYRQGITARKGIEF